MIAAPSVQRALAVKTTGSITFVKLSDIVWIEAADYYSRLHLAAASHLLRKTMTELERDLDEGAFCRVHRSAIVKLDRVVRLEINGAGDYDVLLDTGARLPVSRRFRKRFEAVLRAERGSA